MIKNESFYARAQKLRNDSTGLFRIVVCEIQAKVFENGDTLHTDDGFFSFANHHASLELVIDVLHSLGITYAYINQRGDYFIIKNPRFI